jgi:MFS family permease
LSGELKVDAGWSPLEPAPEKRRGRKKKAPPVTRGQILLAGLKRIGTVLIVLVGLISGGALLAVHFSDTTASRAFPLAFYVGGVFLACGGVLGATTGPSADWMPETGYDHGDRQRGLNNSLVYCGFGVVLIVVGAVLDSNL